MFAEVQYWELVSGKQYLCWLSNGTWQVIYYDDGRFEDSNGMSYHGSELVEIYELPERGSNVAVA